MPMKPIAEQSEEPFDQYEPGPPEDEMARYTALCEAAGKTVHYAGPRELFIDIDTEEQYATFQRNIVVMKREFGYEDAELKVRETPSARGGAHRHIRIEMPGPDLDPTERIAWQAALGSDPMRELLCMFRVRRGCPNPTIFAEKAG